MSADDDQTLDDPRRGARGGGDGGDHLDDLELLDLRGGRLDGARREAALRHLAECDACETLIGVLDDAPAAGDPLRAADFGARFEIETELGRGGMGQVLLATDRLLGRQVALKISRDPRTTWRLRREVAITARLQHPGIIAVYDAGTIDGHPCYAMRPIAGTSLASRLATATSRDDRIQLVPALAAATEAIAYAHSVGVIHRDLTPGNIMLGEFGETVVIDWGLARSLGDDEPVSADVEIRDATTDGAVVGTPMYMAPEQARGERPAPSTDVYALGAVLYQIITGHMPWDVGASAAVGALISGDHFPIRGELPPELAAIVTKATASAQRDRYRDAGELAAELRRYLGGRLVEAHHYTAWARFRRWLARNRLVAATGAAALIVVVVIGAVAVSRVLFERDRAELERARAAAERESAEELLGHLATRLPIQLRPLGRLDLLDDTAARIEHYFRRVQAARPDAMSRLQLVKALMLRAETTSARTRSDDSRKLEDEAAGMLATIPAGPERDLLLAELTVRRAALAESRGDTPDALALATDALAKLEALPATPEVEDLIANIECRIASMLMYTDLAAAERHLAAAGVAMDAAGDFPDPDRRTMWRAVLAYERGQLAWLTSKLDVATTEFARGRALIEPLVKATPQSTEFRDQLVVLAVSGAMVELDRGNTAEAAALFAAVLPTVRAAITLDPTDRKARDTMISALFQQARLEQAVERPDGVIAANLEAIGLIETGLKDDPKSSLLLQRAVLAFASLLNDIEVTDRARAARWLARGRELGDRLLEVDPSPDNRCRRAALDMLELRIDDSTASTARAIAASDAALALLPADAACGRYLAIDTLLEKRSLARRRGDPAGARAAQTDGLAKVDQMVKDQLLDEPGAEAYRVRFRE